MVTCIGHLLEQAQPDAYDSRYARWNLADLPDCPGKVAITATTLRDQTTLTSSNASCMKPAKSFTPGPRIVKGNCWWMECWTICNWHRKSASRCSVADKRPEAKAVERAIRPSRSDSEFVPLCVSALARARADWLYGINMTRAYTILGRDAGYQGVFPSDTCRRPCFGLVVRRDEEIENFVAKRLL
ncbi:hypothetical protein ACNKHX_08915 [Shigella flexneri]